MNSKIKQRGTYEDDLEDKYFEDDEEEFQTKQNESEEEDPLDAYMKDVDQQAKEDLEKSKDKKTQKEERLISDDPLESYMDGLKKKLIQEHHRKHGKPAQTQQKKKENCCDDDSFEDDEGEEIEDENYEFLNSDGELDLEALRKKKKQKIEPLPPVDHSQIKYEPFNKNFYEEHEEIKNLPEETVKKIRNEMEIRVSGTDIPKPIVSFAHLPFDEQMMDKIIKQEFSKPTPIQCQALPCILSGRDVIGVAKTGSGKTLTYVWPLILHALDQRPVERGEGPIGLILCPTRELAQQVYLESKRFAKIYNIKVASLLGGENKHEQWKELKAGVDIIIATPGRLIDMVKKKATNLRRCTYVVLDEADRMFSMGFEYQVRSIIGQIRPDRQVLLFSATFKKQIQQLCFDILNDPIRINVGKDNQANEDVQQEVVVFWKKEDKFPWLLANLPYCLERGKVLIFVNQIASCEELAESIKTSMNLETLVLHGDKLQMERTTIINQFKSKGTHNILIATDVASRGLDVPEIRTVINYENPKDGETHIHRVGRTGRAGNKEGIAYTLILRSEVKFATILIKNLELSGQPVPKELEQIALEDDEYSRNQKMRKIGLKKNTPATANLDKILKRGKKGTAGLGYEEDKPAKDRSEDFEQNIKFKDSSNFSTQNSYGSTFSNFNQSSLTQANYSYPSRGYPIGQPGQTFVPQQTSYQNYYQPKTFTPSNTMASTITNSSYSIPNKAPSSREEILGEYSARLKNTMASQFKSSFVSSERIESSGNLPKVILPKKYLEKKQAEAQALLQQTNQMNQPAPTSHTPEQIPSQNVTVKRKSRFTDRPVEEEEGADPQKKQKSNWD